MNRLFFHGKNLIILTPFLWAFSGLFYTTNGKKQIGVLMLISIILIVYSYGKKILINNFKENKELWILFSIVIYSIFIFLIFEHRPSQLRSWIFSFLFLVFVPKTLLTKKLFYCLVLLGSCFVISYAVWFSFIQGLGRTWPVNVIPFSTFSAIISIFSFILFYFEKKKILKLVLLISFLFSITSIAIGQSRGVWFALIITISVSFLILTYFKRVSYKSCIVFILIALFSIAFSYQKIEQRINSTIVELETIESGNFNTSIGLRIKLWSAAIELSKISPFFGLQNDHLLEFNIKYKNSSNLKMEALKNYSPSHYHMDIINTIVKSGFVGLTFFLLPIIYIIQCFRKKKDLGSCLVAGMISIYLIAGLTDIPLTHGNHVLFFWMSLYYLTNNKDFDELLLKPVNLTES